MMQVKDVGEAIGDIPPFGQRRPHIEVLITLQQVIED